MPDSSWIIAQLAALYPNPKPELNFTNPYETLIASLLSAQTTDKQVNSVTVELFGTYPDAAALAVADISDVERIIRPIGFFHVKAVNAINTCKLLLERHRGEVPRTLEELTALPGVGRKVANVVLANAFGIPAFAVDTHVQRVANRLGLAQSKTPLGTEQSLTGMIPPEMWLDMHHCIILHGRRVCHAQKPACDRCTLAPACKHYLEKGSDNRN